MQTYLQHFGLRQPPFENVAMPEFFFGGRQHREAMERLLYLVRDGNMGFGLLTGEIGCGKTMLLQSLCQRLRGTEAQVVMLESAFGQFDDLLRDILQGMAKRPGQRYSAVSPEIGRLSRYELVRRFRQQVETRVARCRRHLVLILDEAQQLEGDALVELKNLTNYSAGGRSVLSVILAGQPELNLTVRELPMIDQRVSIRYHLMPLEVAEVGPYIENRIAAAAEAHRTIFDDAAKQALAEETGGIPREINRICKLALDRAFAAGRRQIDAETIRTIAADMLRQNAKAY